MLARPRYSVRFDFLFERGAKRDRRIAVAQEERAIAEAEVLDAVRALKLDVQQAFVDLQLAQENLALARENAAGLEEIVTLESGTRTRRRRGRGRAAPQSRRSLAVAAGGAQRQSSRSALSVGAWNVSSAGCPAHRAFEIQALDRPAPIADSATDLLARALRARPDLQALQRTQARSQAEIRLQMAQGQIDFTLGAEYRRQQGLAGRGNSLGLFFSTPLPLFDRNQGNIARARARSARLMPACVSSNRSLPAKSISRARNMPQPKRR